MLELEQSEVIAILNSYVSVLWPGDELAAVDEADLNTLISRAEKQLDQQESEPDFIPAANSDRGWLKEFFEYLRIELRAIGLASKYEDVWFALRGTDETDPFADLVETGVLVKLRAVWEFLCSPHLRFPDEEVRASEFFSAGSWERIRDDRLRDAIEAYEPLVHKQHAHLSMKRPWSWERDIYRTSCRDLIEITFKAVREFVDLAPDALVPSDFSEWFREFDSQIHPPLDILD